MSRILECLRSKFEDFTHKKSITRQINQIHCFKGAHLTLSQIQFEGAHLRILQCNPKNAKLLHLPDLRQKRVCYQSNVPPQTAMCPLPWEPWETLLRTGVRGSPRSHYGYVYSAHCYHIFRSELSSTTPAGVNQYVSVGFVTVLLVESWSARRANAT